MTEEREEDIREAIQNLLEKRGEGKTICPYEASRAVFGGMHGNGREFMDRTRAVARTMVDEGRIEVCQKGQVVDMDNCKGPIRLRMKG
jgi:hypothetical protein